MNMSGGEVKITQSGSFGIGAKNLNIQNAAYVNLDGTAGDISLGSNISYDDRRTRIAQYGREQYGERQHFGHHGQ